MRKTQIKTTLRFHLTPVGTARIKRTKDNKRWHGYGERGTLKSLLTGVPTGSATRQSEWRILKKPEIDLPYDPAIPLLGIVPKDSVSYYRDTYSSIFIAPLSTIAMGWKHPRCPSTEEWVMKILFTHTREHYSVVKKLNLGNSQVN